MELLAHNFHELYYQIKFNAHTDRYITPERLYDFINYFEDLGVLTKTQIGKSVEERPIYLLKFGKGEKDIFIWSQMHGNEPTGTLAMLDIFNSIISKQFESYWLEILRELRFNVILMLNPDGAVRFQRRNAMGIDNNRDVLKRATPETDILFKTIESIKPYFAFNLHDQRTFFSVANTLEPATISFLIPAYNQQKEINKTRAFGMALTGQLFKNAGPYKRFIARYNDEFYPNSSGDNIQKMGINSLLIESGGHYNDPFKRTARMLNVFFLLKSFGLLSQNFSETQTDTYFEIPENTEKMRDLILRNVQLENTTIDLAVQYEEKLLHNQLIRIPKLDDAGDLIMFKGLKEIDLSHKQISSTQLNNWINGQFSFKILEDLILGSDVFE